MAALYIAITLTILIGISFILFPTWYRSDYEKKVKKDFYPRLKEVLKTQPDKENVINLFDSLSQKWGVKFSLAWLLEDFLTNHKAQPDTKRLLKEIIKEEKTLRPFENLPDEEKRIIESTMLLLRDNYNDNKELIMENLSQLGTVINTRDAIYRISEKENKRSLLYAKIGLILTLTTSLLGIFLTATSIDYERIEKSNSKTEKTILQKLDSLNLEIKHYNPEINKNNSQ
ncbi:MAG: hypothetical protein E6767_11960 [Dysgonomonas sp.]|nr:hypothetical protein [Dysgonomonas sp.]